MPAIPPLDGVVSVKASRDFARGIAARDLGYSRLDDGFQLRPGQYGSGELTVHDLRGRLVFRSVYNQGTKTWSAPAAHDLKLPVYMYSFRDYSGGSFNGLIRLGGGDL
jgi:hypothetical protein